MTEFKPKAPKVFNYQPDWDWGPKPDTIDLVPLSEYKAIQALAETCLKEKDELIYALKKELKVTKAASDIFEENSKTCAEEFEKRLAAEKERDRLLKLHKAENAEAELERHIRSIVGLDEPNF